MKINGTQYANANIQFQRLLSEDIVRLPSKTNIADFYVTKQDISFKHQKKQHTWRNIFTALTFGITGLFIAHRNNLFNPARREMKRIIKNDAFIAKVKNRVYSLLGDDTFKSATEKLLSRISKGKNSKSQVLAEEARKILSSNQDFSDVYREVQKRLSDDKPNSESWKNGFVVAVLDKLAVSIEKDLKRARIEGRDYKKIGKQLAETIFEPAGSKSSQVDETLFDVIINRISSTVENFVRDSAINSNLTRK